MRLSFVIIIFNIMVNSRTYDSDEFDEHVNFVDTYLDFRGNFRRMFFVSAPYDETDINMVCSPFSALMPLGKLALGADGKTKKELLKALGLESSKQIRTMFSHLITNMEFLPGVTLDLATNIYIASDKDFNHKFIKQAKQVFRSECGRIDTSDPSGAARRINNWVSKKTNRKINELVHPHDINKRTSAIMVSALYFHGKWKNKFDSVFIDYFETPKGRRRTPMMTRRGDYDYWYCDELKSQVVIIPYEGDNAALIIVLPDERNGLAELLRELKVAPDLLNDCFQKMKTATMILTMPKFMIESELNLASMYEKIGLKHIFDRRGDGLPNIVDGENVYVSKAKQKTIIEVNERGTEAAAASDSFSYPNWLWIERRGSYVERPLLSSGMIWANINSNSNGIVLSPKFFDPGIVQFEAKRPFLFIVKAYYEQLFAGCFNGM